MKRGQWTWEGEDPDKYSQAYALQQLFADFFLQQLITLIPKPRFSLYGHGKV